MKLSLGLTPRDYSVAGGAVAYDTDAQAYFTANTAITSAADKNAINTFYLGLKSDGIYTKIKAMYLPLWSTATNNKWNLVNPLDTNGAFRLTFATGMTFTPLLGMSNVVRRFLSDKSPDRHVTTMTIDDAEHYSPEQRARIIASYPAHEREARTKGVPTLGSGRIFPVPEESIRCEPLAIPRHWPLIGGIDFGWDHPTAAAKLAWDRDADIVYVVAAYRVKEATPVIHAGALKSWGPTLPWAWPHDGLQHDKGSGLALAEQYRTQGLSMLPDRATFPDGSNGVEAGLMEMLDRMQTGRLKVFAHLSDWFDEFRLYHREDGKVVKEYDDLMSATRYALMMLRNAMPADRPTPRRSEHAGAGGWMG